MRWFHKAVNDFHLQVPAVLLTRQASRQEYLPASCSRFQQHIPGPKVLATIEKLENVRNNEKDAQVQD